MRFSSVLPKALNVDFSRGPRVFPRILREMRRRRQCAISVFDVFDVRFVFRAVFECWVRSLG